MRIGIGTHVGEVSVFASKSAHPGNAAWGCLVWFLRLAILPVWLLYLYIKWCIKNNRESGDAPIYVRPWAITSAVLAALFVAAGVYAALSPNGETAVGVQSAPSSASSPASAPEATPAFAPEDGYDMVQSLFLSLEGDGATYAGFMQNVEGSGLEYLDRYIAGGQCVEVWLDHDGQEYTNKLEVMFYNAGEAGEYIRTAEYWHDDSAVKISLHNDLEAYEDGSHVLCIIDANEKQGATYKVTDYTTVAQAMDAIKEK